MKKIISLFMALGLIVSLSGCGKKETKEDKDTTKTLTCTKTTEEDGMKSDNKVVVTYNDEKILTVEETETSVMDKSLLDMSYNFGTKMAEGFNKVDGMEMTYEKVNDTTLKSVIKMDYTKLKAENMKEALGDGFDEEDFNKSIKMNIDEFKKEELEGYTCK